MGLKTGMSAGVSRALSFAHLGARARASDDNDKPDDDARRAQDDDGDNDKPDDERESRQAQRAQDDDKDTENDARAQDDDGDDKPDDDRGKRGRKARAQDDDGDAEDDDDESEMRGASAAASARRREQARCAAIFATRAAGRNPVLAAQFAFRTRLPRGEAIAMLEAAPAPASTSTDRAARNPQVGPGGSPETHSRQAIASGWDHAFAKVSSRAR